MPRTWSPSRYSASMDGGVSVVRGLAVSHISISVLRFMCGVETRSYRLEAERVAMVLMGMRVVLMSLGDQRGQSAVMAVRAW